MEGSELLNLFLSLGEKSIQAIPADEGLKLQESPKM